MTRGARLALVLIVTLIAQTVVVDNMAIFGVRLDLWIVVTVAAGLGTSADRGAAVGFLCGVIFDLTQNGPIGLGALVMTVSGYLVGSVARSVVGASRWIPVLAATATTSVAVSAYIVMGILLGERAWLDTRMVQVVVVVTVGAALLTPPMVRIMAWTDGEPLGISRPGGRTGSRGRFGRSSSGRRGGRIFSSSSSLRP
jgi:rod shape-determining protein MreD